MCAAQDALASTWLAWLAFLATRTDAARCRGLLSRSYLSTHWLLSQLQVSVKPFITLGWGDPVQQRARPRQPSGKTSVPLQ